MIVGSGSVSSANNNGPVVPPVKKSSDFSPYTSCMQTIFQWEEKITLKFDSTDIFRRRMRDIGTGDVYISRTSDAGLRALFACLTVLATPISILRMAARSIDLLSYEFATNGYEQASEEWNVEWLKWVQGHRETPPSNLLFYGKTVLYTSWQLIKEIAKIVTLPLAGVAMTFAALYGAVAQPQDGRKMWGAIERFWSRDIVKQRSHLSMRVLDFIAPCCQPKRVWDEQGIQEVRENILLKGTLRGLLYSIETKLRKNEEFFTELGVQVDALRMKLQEYRATILNSVSSHDCQETDAKDTKLEQTSDQIAHAKVLSQLLQHLSDSQMDGEKIVSDAQKIYPLPLPKFASQAELVDRVSKINGFNLQQFPKFSE